MKKILLALAILAMPLGAFAQFGVVAPLHVNGNQLNDQYGNKVVLHGVMDTPNPYFNKNRWGYASSDANVSACISYFDKLFTAITNTKQGAYCNIFRLHLDPCWTNDPSKTSSGSETGEANISRFSSTRLQKYLNALYWQIAQKAIYHGLYVVVRPPGVCPKNLKVGDNYQNYLKTVWNIISSNSNIKSNSGVISLELANEPVNVYDSNGNVSTRALYDYFQPIVNIIRSNGFKGIIWVPGTGYQSQYQNYASYPIQDSNYGYAVHVYPGWYGASDKSYNHTSFINQFKTQVPVVTSKPILVSEIDWSPEQAGSGKYNEFGQWVASNLGTWGTATTSKWGNAFKAVMDYYGNISMTLSSTDDYINIDKYLSNGIVTPAFDGNTEACGKTCFDWYKAYAQVNYAHNSTTLSTLIPAFSSDADDIVPADWNLVDNGSSCTAGNASSGPRIMKFVSGGDFGNGLYVRGISPSKDGYAEYGTVNGHYLTLSKGTYQISFNAVAWNDTPYIKCVLLSSSTKAVIATKIVQCTKSINRNRSVKISGATAVSFSANVSASGNYILRFIPVNDAAGNAGYWREVVFGNVKISAVSSATRASEETENIISAIENTEGDKTIDKGYWYTLQGVKLNGKPTETGIYIHNGKKVFIK